MPSLGGTYGIQLGAETETTDSVVSVFGTGLSGEPVDEVRGDRNRVSNHGFETVGDLTGEDSSAKAEGAGTLTMTGGVGTDSDAGRISDYSRDPLIDYQVRTRPTLDPGVNFRMDSYAEWDEAGAGGTAVGILSSAGTLILL